MITKTDDLQGKDRMKGFVRAHCKSNKIINSRLMVTFDTYNIGGRPENFSIYKKELIADNQMDLFHLVFNRYYQ